jgi:hypothetical protein
MSVGTQAARGKPARPAQRIFGIPLSLDPKILVGVLIAFAAGLFWFNSRNDDTETSATAARPQASVPATEAPGLTKPRSVVQRRRGRTHDDSGTLKLRPIDATRGDVDPVLRLDLLERLQSVKPATSSRNVFETAAAAPPPLPVPVRTVMPGPTISSPPVTPQYPPIVQPVANIPLKYYGFAKPFSSGEANRGFFLQGDDVLMAGVGDLLQQQYRVLQLTATTAKVEDTRVHLSQTLNVVPEAAEQQ